MEALIGYNPALVVGKSTVTGLTTSEATLLTVTDTKLLKSSQLSIYISVELAAVASATFYYYFACDGTLDWYPVCLYNTSTGAMTQRSVVIDSSTYVSGSNSFILDNVPMPAGAKLKITGKCASGTIALNNLVVMGRDN